MSGTTARHPILNDVLQRKWPRRTASICLFRFQRISTTLKGSCTIFYHILFVDPILWDKKFENSWIVCLNNSMIIILSCVSRMFAIQIISTGGTYPLIRHRIAIALRIMASCSFPDQRSSPWALGIHTAAFSFTWICIFTNLDAERFQRLQKKQLKLDLLTNTHFKVRKPRVIFHIF